MCTYHIYLCLGLKTATPRLRCIHCLGPWVKVMSHYPLSVPLKMHTSVPSRCSLRVVHYLKARNLGIDLLTTNRGIKTRVGQIESLLMHLQSSDPMIVCGFKFEFVFYTKKSLLECYHLMKDFLVDHQGVTEGVVMKKYVTPQQYIEHLVEVVDDVKANHLTAGESW